ncbi:MAG: type I 3-dehydroquinate dehydratase [Thermoplasmata archaeon]|nr:type I 3-dehydroquinate dehydratase [Thermoplasmata archaeon]
MRGRRPLRIVTLPGRTVPELHAELPRAAASGGELAEVRVDRLPPSERAELRRLFPAALPLIATYRSRAEGGEGEDGAVERAAVFSQLGGMGFAAFDREARRDPVLPGSSPAIVSYHSSASTPVEELRRQISELVPGSWFVKSVLPASLTDVFTGLLGTIPTSQESSFVLHTTGPSGALLRVWADRLGMAAVYCALPTIAGSAAPVEPAQIPVDRMRRYQMGSGARRLFAVLGRPVDHSASPALHSAWFDAADRRALYIALEVVSESELAETLPRLFAGGFAGVNVTHPWKTAALALATESSRGATRCGCANTLRLDGETVRAENTDLVAVLRRLGELRAEGRWDGARVTVLGAGGAARATLAASEAMGAQVTVVARRREEAEVLAREFGAEHRAWNDPHPSSLLVHATVLGRNASDAPPAPLVGWIARGGWVLDFVYGPKIPVVSDAAISAGATYEDGWRLLVYQAAESYRIWWETPPPTEVVRRQLEGGTCEG